MTRTLRGSSVWLGMILSGLALGGYVFAAWPDTSPRAVPRPEPVRTTASVSHPDFGLAGIGGALYVGDYFIHDFGTAPALDAVTGAPVPVDAG